MIDVRARLRARLAPMLAGTGAVALLLGGATLALAPSAGAATVDPTVAEGNPNCETYKLSKVKELKFESPASGNTSDTSADGEFAVTVIVDGGSQNFSFAVTKGIALLVIVKGGDLSNVYDYQPNGTLGDTGLRAPDNKGGQQPNLSHITFCYDKGTPPTTPPTTLPTTPPTTLPTTPPTSPPTESPSTPPTSPPTSEPSESPSTPTAPPSSQPTSQPPTTPTAPPSEQPSTPSESPTESPSESESPSPGVPTDIDAGQGGESGGLNLLGGNGSGPSPMGLGLLAAGAAMVAGGVVLARQRRGRHSA